MIGSTQDLTRYRTEEVRIKLDTQGYLTFQLQHLAIPTGKVLEQLQESHEARAIATVAAVNAGTPIDGALTPIDADVGTGGKRKFLKRADTLARAANRSDSTASMVRSGSISGSESPAVHMVTAPPRDRPRSSALEMESLAPLRKR